MMDKETADCTVLISKHFQLDDAELSNAASLSDLQNLLSGIIQHLLDHDLNHLLNACYKIDISEQKFKTILSTTEPREIADQLAQTIVDREILKVKTRKKYRL